MLRWMKISNIAQMSIFSALKKSIKHKMNRLKYLTYYLILTIPNNALSRGLLKKIYVGSHLPIFWQKKWPSSSSKHQKKIIVL